MGAHARGGGIVYMGRQRLGWRLPQRLEGRHVHAEDDLGERCVTGECHPRGGLNGAVDYVSCWNARHAREEGVTDVFTKVVSEVGPDERTVIERPRPWFT